MRLPAHPHLLVLRSVVTLELSALIGQAGWAAAAIGGERHYLTQHRIGAVVTLALCVAGALVYVALRRSAGPVNLVLALLLAVLVAAQYALGQAHAVSVHVFLGVLIVMAATALTSWTYRHHLPGADAGAAAEAVA